MSDDPGHESPTKADPAAFVLRARPRRIIRFRRRRIVALAGLLCLALFAALWVALYGSNWMPHIGDQDIAGGNRKSAPDSLSALPGSYDQIKKPVPQLGPPLPGDLGPAVVQKEKSLGIAPVLRPNPEEDAERAERMRLAQQARQAKEAGVMFQLSHAATMTESMSPSASAPTAGLPPVSNSAASPDRRLALDPDRDQNDQQRKLDFVNQQTEQRIYNPHALQNPISPYLVMAGSLISASLLTGINSDLPGLVVAQVTENIYDTVTGHILLIPQGSRLVGSYDSVVAFGQSRALLVWQRIIMPNGTSIQIDNLPATDQAGYAGLEDQVDYHTWTLLKGIALSTLLGVGAQIGFSSAQSDLVQAVRESTQQSVNQAGQRIVQKDLNIQPTITVRPGWPLRVIVHKDLILRPYRG
ncbi:MAG: TrbI/VirB10 family protein [Proteobacteria bacterium]|nr:TrbI/VirB10 family protein [Pseudomonadota bacterium]